MLRRAAWASALRAATSPESPDLFSFPNKLAPIDAAVFPLVNKDKLPETAEKIFLDLFKQGFTVFYDDSGSIGKRYRRQDEIGTKNCLTIDFDSIKQNDVTLRDRDTMQQVRIKIKDLKENLNKIKN